MGWTRTRRAACSAALATVITVSVTALSPAGAEKRAAPAPSSVAAAAEQPGGSKTPQPPQLPRNFRAKGKWIVRDLGITVPFTWEGKNGDSQMTAGGPQYPIWFTNLIYRNTLYTITFKWPGLNVHPCSQIPGFNLRTLNRFLAGSRFVGRETLRLNKPRHVNHWRVGVVLPERPPGLELRFPIALADVYVDERNRGTFWQLLQFGLQNLYDPELDEWAKLDSFVHKPGKVKLPAECAAPGTQASSSKRS
ncbi:hypothetical protein [Streptomyces sp. WMMB 322]|uniref:hypothetical protein n=1 Tax=Streptomyces sp. WMMB 322 TaxID=1286821 RepID=UPI000823AFAA|nr:hypothetical protein [Streptomyces sp. WMMB 322]SCK41838.1 hypothetical protein H180DRAFT_03625 [Streptomyces sp. WMMB 322]